MFEIKKEILNDWQARLQYGDLTAIRKRFKKENGKPKWSLYRLSHATKYGIASDPQLVEDITVFLNEKEASVSHVAE